MKVLLGVTGGVAAYKSLEILRSLQEHGTDVDVILTRSARRFLTPLTFAAFTGKPVHTSLWAPVTPPSADAPIEHIAMAQSIDVLLVAPATANTIARFAHGFAPDLLSTVYLATPAPTVLAPAMNVHMWQHPATQANLATLAARGTQVVAPESGPLACGMNGPGRLAATESIVSQVLRLATPQDLADETVLVTAGGTREALDPVRFLGNRSSGRMGHALAAAAHARGARVILITASPLPAPPGTQVIRVQSTAEMGAAIGAQLPGVTLVFAAAAIADFRPVAVSATKIRREGSLSLQLEPTPDLLARIARERAPGTLVVGFAAELDDVQQNGRLKLIRKGVDAIVANDVSDGGIGFDSQDNAGWFITADGTALLPRMAKRQMAERILDRTMQLRHASRANTPGDAQAAISTAAV